METIKVVKKKIKLTLDKDEYFIQIPNARQLNEFSKQKDTEDIESFINFLDELGLPADVGWELDADVLGQITEKLMPQKKS